MIKGIVYHMLRSTEKWSKRKTFSKLLRAEKNLNKQKGADLMEDVTKG